VGALRRFEEFVNDEYGHEYEFAKRLKMRRRPVRMPRPVAFGELYHMLEGIPVDTVTGMRDRAICELLYCGLRNQELCNTRIQDFVNTEVRVLGKGNKERLVPLNDEAWKRAMIYGVEYHGGIKAPEDMVELHTEFCRVRDGIAEPTAMFRTAGNKPVTTDTVRDIVYSAAKRAGLKDISPHKLRHSFATHLLDFGVTDPFALKDVLGHESLDMINFYTRTSRTRRFTRVNAFHPRQLGIVPKKD
jgi:site-specific recombinase XerD